MSRPDNTAELDDEGGIDIAMLCAALRKHSRLLLAGPIAAGALAFGIATLLPSRFTATTTIMPPQQSQSAAASALAASLGSLAGLAGGAAGLRTSGDLYVGLMQSVTVSDRLIEQFKLLGAYDLKFKVDARKELAQKVRMTVGKKDGLINIEVEDHDPKRAAGLANQYVEELRSLLARVAVTEAQQRRLFFENQLKLARDRMVQAQQALQASGFDAGALKVEPKAAAESYARLKAEATSAEMRLQVLRGTLAESTPEVQQQQAALAALRAQLVRAERSVESSGSGPDYVGRYREFKYQETLFEMYARQFELARIDEGREGGLIQVLDPATAPEKKSGPRRGLFALGGAGLMLAALLLFIVLRLALAPAVAAPPR